MLPVISFINNATRAMALTAKKYAPQIALFGGISLGLGGVVVACIETRRLDGILEETKEELKNIHDKSISDNTYTEDNVKKDTFKVYAKATGRIVNNYKWAAGMEVASVISILIGFGAINKRYVNTALALASMSADFGDYRKEVRERYGDDVDNEIRYGYKTEEIKEKTTDEDGKTKTVKKKINVLPEKAINNTDDYRRVFDKTNPWWDQNNNDIRYYMMFLRSQQSYFNDLLRANKYVFFNDVLKALGFPKTRVGQEVGWVYNPDNGDGYIDFRITESYVEDEFGSRRQVILLDFNVDGSILNKAEFSDVVGELEPIC